MFQRMQLGERESGSQEIQTLFVSDVTNISSWVARSHASTSVRLIRYKLFQGVSLSPG